MAGPRPIPKDTAAVLTAEALADCRNLGLLLDRLNPWERVGANKWDLAFHVEEWVRREQQWQPATRRGGEAKGLWLSDQRDDRRTRLLDEPLLRRSHIDTALLDAHRVRWEQLVAHHGADEKSGLRFDLRTESRLVVGLGADSVLETAITLHRIYGFPIIPGSALKGLTRTWALLKLAAALGVPALDYEQFQARKGPKVENKQPTPLNHLESLLEADLDAEEERQQEALGRALEVLKQERPVKDANGDILGMDLAQFKSHKAVRDFRAVFGYPGWTGGGVFFDAVPVEEPLLAADVMNVHYPDYYQDEKGKMSPSDDQNPNPISFLTVAEGATFRFAVGGRRRGNSDDLTCARKARRWLEQALRETGVGAKTTIGYGYFGDRPPVKFGRAGGEPPVPPPSPTKPGRAKKASPRPLSENREQEMKSLTDAIMRRLYGEGE